MLLQFAIVLISLHMGTAQRILAVDREALREEFRRQVSTVIEQTTTNVSTLHQLQCGIEGATLRDEISEQTNATLEFIAESNREHESTAEELKKCIREVNQSVNRELREVKESVNREVREVNNSVNRELIEVKESVNRELREVNKSVNREVREVNNSVNRELREVKECVTRELREVNATMETVIEAAVSTAVEAAVEKATKPIEQLLQSLLNDVALLRHLRLGHAAIPASSCSEILAAFPSSPSGYYWLRAGNGSSIRVYCDMTRTCGGITGGWMQVANIDMTDSSHTCPQGLKTLTSPKRLCGINISGGGCSSATFATHGTKYIHVCGMIIGYQKGNTPAFYDYIHRRGHTVDDNYVTGVSLTQGSNPRKHIWTFAAALHEGTSYIDENCPCTNTGMQSIPPWVGQDYFCDTAVEDWGRQGRHNHLYPDDPLWDGEGCGPTSTCCSFNNPPWFSKQLLSPTTDDIEMRLCGRDSRSFQDVPLEVIELYVQ